MDRQRPDRAADPSRPRPLSNPFAPSRESLIERQIREAQERGAFDDLPFRGERIPLEDDSLSGDLALAHRILRNAHMAPPWIETDREVRALLARRDAIHERASTSGSIGRARDVRELRRLVEEVNRAIATLNSEAPTDRQHRRPLRLDAELERLAERHRAPGPSGEPEGRGRGGEASS